MDKAFHAAHAAVEESGWWHVGRRRVLGSVLAAALPTKPREGELVLDVGCGGGATTAWLMGQRRVVGCDIAPEALQHARGRGLTHLVRASGEALPFRDSSFELVLALDVLEHHDDDARVAAELARVLKPGGLLLATVPAFSFLWGPHDVISHHHRRYRLPQLVTLLEKVGFRVRHSSYFNSILFPAVAAVQLARRALRGGRPPAPANDNPEHMPRFVNAMLREAFALEGLWLPEHSLPFGVSALALAEVA